MKTMTTVAATVFAVMFGMFESVAQAQVTADQIRDVLKSELEPVRDDVRRLNNRVSGLESGAPAATTSGGSMTGSAQAAGMRLFCDKAAASASSGRPINGVGKTQLEAWLREVDGLVVAGRRNAYGFDLVDCQFNLRQARANLANPKADDSDPMRPKVLGGIQATERAHVGFPAALEYGTRDVGVRGLVGVSTFDTSLILGGDVAFYPLQWHTWQLGLAGRATAVTTDNLENRKEAVLGVGPRARIFSSGGCDAGAFVDVTYFPGSWVGRDYDQTDSSDIRWKYTPWGGTIDVGYQF